MRVDILTPARLAEEIRRGAALEGCAVEQSDIERVMAGGVSAGLASFDVTVVVNLLAAWRYLLSTPGERFGPGFVRRINARVAHGMSLAPGEWRDGPVGISGTDWRPPEPDAETIGAVFSLTGSAAERAVTFAARAMRAQLFWDGNKRTAMLAASHLLLSAGAGTLSIPVDGIPAFNHELTGFYNSGDPARLTVWLLENAVEGLGTMG